ncbi:MAG: hypothetical protein HY200_09645 [Nitrospirae bacterium]|nr:hypothetical protein [Nitrospirota bacterium]MBI3595207.1 hypothetical protein [Nitrospirota bacterium]
MNNEESLQKQYFDYFELIIGRTEYHKSSLASMVRLENQDALHNFQRDYLKDQILNWSGIIEEIFSNTVTELKKEGIDLNKFVSFFHQEPLSLKTEYDFFKIKLDRFRVFVTQCAEWTEPATRTRLLDIVDQEYHSCRKAYLAFNPPD